MRRTRIDLGQKPASSREESALARKRHRWEARNKHLPPSENPFLEAIKPKHENYGDPSETHDDLRKRLENLEFGNFPGYFNYRNKAAVERQKSAPVSDCGNKNDQAFSPANDKDADKLQASAAVNEQKSPLDCGLSDERLKCFDRKWFEGKDVLDIGCNRGHITYAIARLFDPNSITGVDIDSKMVNMANRDLHLHIEGPGGVIAKSNEYRKERAARLRLEDGSTMTYTEDLNQFPLSSYISHGPLAAQTKPSTTELKIPASYEENPIDSRETKSSNTIDEDIDKNRQTATDGDNNDGKLKGRFPNNIVFIEHNYVPSKDELVERQKPFFDTIICLSVTKWIHCNYCDIGLKRFFKRIYNHLKPGGLFVLEAQPYDNYGRRRKLSDRLKANLYSIQFKPEQFDAYLLSPEIGFREIIYQTIGRHECVGFRRPLKVFMK